MQLDGKAGGQLRDVQAGNRRFGTTLRVDGGPTLHTPRDVGKGAVACVVT
jgi:hypothetical protein